MDDDAPVLLPEPDYIKCPICKRESQYTTGILMNNPLFEDIVCEECEQVIVSINPIIKEKTYKSTGVGFNQICEYE